MSAGVDIESWGAGLDAKLPLWNSICRSYSAWFTHFPDVLRISWLWLAVCGLMSWWQLSWFGGVLANIKQGVAPQVSPQARALIYVAAVIWLLAAASITVAWQRRVVLGERPRLSGSNLFTGSLWRYVGVGLLIAIVAVLPALVLVLLLSSIALPIAWALGARAFAIGVVSAIVVVVLYVAVFTVVLRLSPVLSARSVGDLNPNFKETWRLTRGNTWRLFWGVVACTFVPLIVVQIVVALFLGLPGAQQLAAGVLSARFGATNIVNIICYMLATPISANFMALAYVHFFKRDQLAVFD